MATLREVIDRHADTQPDAPFLLAPEPGTTITYAALRATARSLDAELAAKGIAPGDVVSYMLPNGVAAASVFLGAMYGGYVVSPVSLLAQDALIEHTLAHSETRIVYARPSSSRASKSIVARIGSRAIVRPRHPTISVSMAKPARARHRALRSRRRRPRC
jgi:long-chain acyl-CoA synthetase